MAEHVVLPIPDQSAEFVLGLRWHTILGQDLQLRARQKAREVRASHYAHAPDSEAVGTLRTNRAHAARRGVVRHSAALAFASVHPRGLNALCMTLPDLRAWLVAVQAGKVLTHTDRVYASLDDARAALQELIARYGSALSIHGDVPDLAAQPFDWSLLIAELKPDIALLPAGLGLAAIPRPLLIVVAGAVLTFCARIGWDAYLSRKQASSVAKVAVFDAQLAWRQAQQQFAAKTHVQPQAEFDRMLTALADVAFDIGGWSLQWAKCEPAVSGGWTCSARYARASRRATNASFLAGRPAQWVPIWQPLDGVVASFQLPSAATALDISSLKPVAWHDETTLTALQQIVPAFSAVAVGMPTPAHIDPPRDNLGAVLAASSGQIEVSERSVSLQGPLRSLRLLPPGLSDHMAWQAIEINVDAAAQPSLNRSRVMAAAQGVLYAKN